MPNDNKIKVFDNDDKSLKILGELLSNDTSRKIIRLLIEKQVYTNEIATTLNIRVSLVIHHLRKLEELGVLEITNKKIVRKGNEHKYFRMVPNLFLAPNETKEDIESKGILKRIFTDSVKFVGIGIAGLAFWLSDLSFYVEESLTVLPIPFSKTKDFHLDPTVLPLIIIIAGLIIERILFQIKKRKG